MMKMKFLLVAAMLAALVCPAGALAADTALRMGPFLQSVSGDKATVLWLSDDGKPGTVQYGLAEGTLDRAAQSIVRAMPEGDKNPRFAHEAVLTGLPAGGDIFYRLAQPPDPAGVACFRSDPGPSGTIRFICGGDEIWFDPYLPFLQARGIRLDLVADCGDYQSRAGRYGRPWWRHTPVYIAWGNHNAPDVEKHWWALPGDKLRYAFDHGPVHFAFSGYMRGLPQSAGDAPWNIAVGHEDLISNGKGSYSVAASTHLADAGFAMRLNGHDHRFDRSYPIRGEQRDPTGVVFLTHAGNHEMNRFVRPVISSYYRCRADSATLLPLFTASPRRLEMRVLMHRPGEHLPEKDWPAGWTDRANPPRDYPHEWDYYVRVKDPDYAAGKLAALRAAIKAGKHDAETTALVRELGGLVHADAAGAIVELLKTARDNTLRREIALALDRIGDPATLPAVKTLAKDPVVMTRLAVARFFAKFGDATDVADLAHFLTDDEELSGQRGPGLVTPQRYYVEGIMLRIGGPAAREIALRVMAIEGDYANYVFRMVAGLTPPERLPMLRTIADHVLASGGTLDGSAVSLAGALGPIADGPEDVARIASLAGKLARHEGWDGIAAGLVSNKATQHVALLAGGYRKVASAGGRGVANVTAVRKAIEQLTGLLLPDPVTGGEKPSIDKTKVEQGATMAEQWAKPQNARSER